MLGQKWAEAAPVVRILALAMPLMTMLVLYSPACDAIGRPDVGVRNGAEGAAILTVAFVIVWLRASFIGRWPSPMPAC